MGCNKAKNLEIAPSNLNTFVCAASILSVKAKFHYATLVADRSEAGRRPASELEFGLSRTI